MKQRLPLEIFAIYFSPYTAHSIEVDGILFPTLEHAYQCQRYTDKGIVDEIRNARSPVKAWETSSRYKHLQIPEFTMPEYKLEVMERLIRLKVAQHEEIRKALLNSNNLEIVKHITTYPPGDGFWDDGEDGTGLNHIGRIWMKVRDDLKR